jgi:hypothetical protein
MSSDCIQADCMAWWTPGANSRSIGCCKIINGIWNGAYNLKMMGDKAQHDDKASGYGRRPAGEPAGSGSSTKGGL